MTDLKTETLRPGGDLTKQAVKFDNGKIRWSLVPPRNWEQGMDCRAFDACIRHCQETARQPRGRLPGLRRRGVGERLLEWGTNKGGTAVGT